MAFVDSPFAHASSSREFRAQAVEQICQSLFEREPELPVSREALNAYIAASNVGMNTRFLLRLGLMKGAVEGRQRYVFFFGETHVAGLQSYFASNRVLRHFNNFALEGRDPRHLDKLSRLVWKLMAVLPVFSPLARIPSRASEKTTYFFIEPNGSGQYLESDGTRLGYDLGALLVFSGTTAALLAKGAVALYDGYLALNPPDFATIGFWAASTGYIIFSEENSESNEQRIKRKL